MPMSADFWAKPETVKITAINTNTIFLIWYPNSFIQQ
jgi:hypothetical protein